MTTLIDKIEQLIKREKTTPDRKKDDTKKSSNEILSELFSAFNADPPQLENLTPKKSKKSKKKHKKEKKKRSRSSSSSDSDGDYSRKHKKRKKSKSKKSRVRRTPPVHRIKDPVKVKSESDTKIKSEPIVKRELHIKEECRIKREERTKAIKKSASFERSLSPPLEELDASLIPMPESPKGDKLDSSDLRHKLEKKSDSENDKAKGKIQIKNLKFSAVFEETVKKAEEEARKKAEKVEDGEYTDTSSSSEKDEDSNSQFPKSSDPGGILKKAAEDIKLPDVEEKSSKKSKSDSSHKSSKRDRSKSKGRSESKKRSRSRSPSRRHRHRSTSRSRRRSHSKSSKRRRSESKSRWRTRSRSRHRSTSRSRHYPRHPSPRHRSSRSGVKLADSEKKRLLEVARRNAINMLKNGAVPAGAAVLPPHTRNQVMAAIQSGGKSVDELTDFCKHLSKKEALGELSSVSSNEGDSDNEDTIAFHHPFLVKEKAPIVMNIRGGAPLPLKSSTLPIANKDELRLQFPVSSGSQHREKASEWVPVSPKKDNMQIAKLNFKPEKLQLGFDPINNKKDEPLALPAPSTTSPAYMKSFTTGSHLTSVPALMPPGPQVMPADHPAVDMAAIVTQKLSLLRKEQEEIELNTTSGFGWSASSLPSTNSLGQFTGSTGANILTPRELASGSQAWAKKDQLVRAAPVEGGMGMHLLQKMGWTPGKGLGKEESGTLQPLLLEVKLDTRGLQAKEEMKQSRMGRRGPAPLIAGGKHPVSLLGEYCSKHKLGPPEYNLCFECGPDHKKNFLFRVKVAGVEYQPAIASANKKQAKADAAQLALQKLGQRQQLADGQLQVSGIHLADIDSHGRPRSLLKSC
ncbi:protein Son isoform X2 [Pieris rapae]|uniref:protein Son isoform X2 n=1 Tax=Pieris rapae TaxID=64459 RepID=UPI001E27B15F|nr:protein Son isoform X2 [Pieris rapae]